MRSLLRASPALAVCLAALAAPLPVRAAPPDPGPPEAVADLGSALSNPASDPRSLLRVGDTLYFSASDPIRGETLWRSDGTAAGTVPVADLCPGRCGVSISELTAVGDRLFFVGYEEPFSFRGGAGWRITLWTSDGTDPGTVPLLQATSPSPTRFSDLTPFGGSLWFSRQSTAGISELWVSDGTREGTHPTGLCPAACLPLIGVGGRLLLHVWREEFDIDLWATDGTPAGTVLLSDVQPALPNDFEPGSTRIGDRVYFAGFDEHTGFEPWVTDGTPEGTVALGDLAPGPVSSGLRYAFPLRGAVYLLTSFTGEPADHPRFWRTDGTPLGTVPAEELLNAGRFTWFDNAAPPIDDRFLYLTLLPLGGEGFELWRFDAATGTSILLHERVMAAAAYGFLGAPLGQGLVFMNGAEGLGIEPWFTDGTPSGTRLLRDIYPGLGWSDGREATSLGDRVVFSAADAYEHRELWVTDGTPAGTELLADVSPDRAASSPDHLTAHRDRLYFAAQGSPPGLYAAAAPGEPVELIAAGAGLTPEASIGDHLYLTDDAGRPMVLGPGATAPTLLAATQRARYFTPGPGGRVFFATFGMGQELWSTDGTPEGTRRVVDLNPRWTDPCFEFYPDCPPPELDYPSYPSGLVAASGRLAFVAIPQGGHVPLLWSTDGTAAGTVPVSPASAGPVYETAAFRGGVLFVVRDAGQPRALWWSDGTAAGTRRLVDFGLARTPERLAVTGAVAFFLVAQEGQPLTLWRSDGTVAGSRPVAPLGTARHLVDADEIVAAAGRAWISVRDRSVGDELWVSDGTAAGTRLVRDLFPGPRGSNPAELTPVGPYLVFAADDGMTGHEPWVSDGTAAGTVPVGDLHAGPAPSSPAGFARFGDRVYFSADDARIDRELWSFALAVDGGGEVPPPPADATEIAAPELAGFRLWVRIAGAGTVLPVRREPCIPETVCVSGAVPGRSELFVRIVGPKPNGNLWPTLVRFSTSTIDVWIEQGSTGILRHYRLEGATPGSSSLDGLFDRDGFPPG